MKEITQRFIQSDRFRNGTISGLVNFHGRPVPVIMVNPKNKFNNALNEKCNIIVVRKSNIGTFALFADQVLRICSISEKQLRWEMAPLENHIMISGKANYQNKTINILDINSFKLSEIGGPQF